MGGSATDDAMQAISVKQGGPKTSVQPPCHDEKARNATSSSSLLLFLVLRWLESSLGDGHVVDWHHLAHAREVVIVRLEGVDLKQNQKQKQLVTAATWVM